MNAIELNAETAAQVYHDMVLTFVVKQDGQPFLESKTTYNHCTDAVVAMVSGNVVAMAGPLGPKGKKAKDANFGVEMSLQVDGKPSASGAWDGLTREHALLFEKQVLQTWLHMNEQAVIQGKAYGKI